MEYLFGKKIRALREAQGLLQRQVAYHLDIDSPMLSNIERGDRRAKREWIPKLENANFWIWVFTSSHCYFAVMVQDGANFLVPLFFCC